MFDPRSIWSALDQAIEDGTLKAQKKSEMVSELSEFALSAVTRGQIIRAAIIELNASDVKLHTLVPAKVRDQVIRDEEITKVCYKILLDFDSMLFETRAFLDLIAKFWFGILKGIGKEPKPTKCLSGGHQSFLDGRGKLRTYLILEYLQAKLKLDKKWYERLQKQRNHFTHAAAPYCAIEIKQEVPPKLDLAIMRKNIVDFEIEDAANYVRLSDLKTVVDGVEKFAKRLQKDLTENIRNLGKDARD